MARSKQRSFTTELEAQVVLEVNSKDKTFLWSDPAVPGV